VPLIWANLCPKGKRGRNADAAKDKDSLIEDMATECNMMTAALAGLGDAQIGASLARINEISENVRARPRDYGSQLFRGVAGTDLAKLLGVLGGTNNDAKWDMLTKLIMGDFELNRVRKEKALKSLRDAFTSTIKIVMFSSRRSVARCAGAATKKVRCHLSWPALSLSRPV
jgi:hypothetical protein